MSQLPQIVTIRRDSARPPSQARGNGVTFRQREPDEPLTGVVPLETFVGSTAAQLNRAARDYTTAYFEERQEAAQMLSTADVLKKREKEERRVARRIAKQRAKERFTESNPRAAGLVHLPGWRDAGATIDTFSHAQTPRLPPAPPFQSQRQLHIDAQAPLERLQHALASRMGEIAELLRSWKVDLSGSTAMVAFYDLRDAVCALRLDEGEGWAELGVRALFNALDLRTGEIGWRALREALLRRGLRVVEAPPPHAAQLSAHFVRCGARDDALPARRPERTYAAAAAERDERRSRHARAALGAKRARLLQMLRSRGLTDASELSEAECQRALGALAIPVEAAALRALFAQIVASSGAGSSTGSGSSGATVTLGALDEALQRNVDYQLDPTLAPTERDPPPLGQLEHTKAQALSSTSVGLPRIVRLPTTAQRATTQQHVAGAATRPVDDAGHTAEDESRVLPSLS